MSYSSILTIEELDRLCSAFIGLGTKKLRLTGGEPLGRRGFMELVERLSRHLQSGALQELTLTTNGTQLPRFAEALARRGLPGGGTPIVVAHGRIITLWLAPRLGLEPLAFWQALKPGCAVVVEADRHELIVP